MRAGIAALALAIASGPAFSPCRLAAQTVQQPRFRSGVDVVAVDVRVVDHAGRPVADLHPRDFVVTVDGAPRTILTANFISYPVSSAIPPVPVQPEAESVSPIFSSNAEARKAPGRTVILFMDEENIRAGYGKWAGDATAAFVDGLQPNDRVGLVVPNSPNAVAPTIDHAAVKAALNHVVGHLVPVAFGEGMGPATAFDKHYENIKEAGKSGKPDPKVEAIVTDVRQRAFGTLRSLTTLLDSLRTMTGPKTVVLVSEELPVSDHREEVAEFNAEFTRLGEAAARSHTMLYVLQLDRPAVDADDVRTSSTDQESSPSRDRDIRSFGLETAVGITGGRRLLVSGRPEAPLARIALELSGHYLLGIGTEVADRDGNPHRINVTVKRTGVDVRARQMFTYAPDTTVVDKTATDAVNRILRAGTVESGMPMSVATYNLLERGDASRVRVLITAEIDRGATNETPLTVGYTITDGGGRNAGAAVEQVTLKPTIGRPDGPLVYTAAAVVPQGAYTLRLAASDSSLRVGSVVHEFEARGAEAGPTRLGDLVVFDRYPVETGKGRPSVSATVADELAAYVEAYVSQASPMPPSFLAARLEIAERADAPARATARMVLQGPDANGQLIAVGNVNLGALPAGNYVARAVFESQATMLGRTTRPIRIVSGVGAAQVASPSTPPSVVVAPASPAGPLATMPRGAPAATIAQAMSRVAGYIEEYAEQMLVIIGTEHYSQWLQREDGLVNAGTARAVSRHLVAELALVRTGSDWDGFRNVYEVDGKPVPDARDRFLKLFAEQPSAAIERSRKIAAESSKYNLGAMQRNFNVPTVALFFLSKTNQGRFRFTKDKDDEVGGVKVWRVRFEETRKPTIIRTSNGKDMPVKGEAWIDPVDGRVLKTHMQIDSEIPTPAYLSPSGENAIGAPPRSSGRLGPTNVGERAKTTASITVTYALESRLSLLVPSEMLETYEAPMRSQFSGEDIPTKISCRAVYSNFKRFETSGRMVTPK